MLLDDGGGGGVGAFPRATASDLHALWATTTTTTTTMLAEEEPMRFVVPSVGALGGGGAGSNSSSSSSASSSNSSSGSSNNKRMHRSRRSELVDADEDVDDDDEQDDDDQVETHGPMRMGTTTTSLFFPTASDLHVFMSHSAPPHASMPMLATTTTTANGTMADELQPVAFLDELLNGAQDDEFASALGGAHATTTTTAMTSVSHPVLGLEPLPPPSLAPLSSPTSSSRLSAERLSQLEDNYERKKKRAKINRRDLNSRFQELMELLHLREDRKLNRAKVLEKAIEHIHQLTAALEAARRAPPGLTQQQQEQQQQTMTTTTVARTVKAPALPTMRVARPVSSSYLTTPGPVPVRPTQPQLHQQHQQPPPHPAPQWPPGSLVWMPCAVPVPTNADVVRASAPRVVLPVPPVVNGPAAPQTAARRASLKRTRLGTGTVETPSSSSPSPAALVVLAQTVPVLLEWCDAWMLVALRGTSRELHRAASRDDLWRRLCQRRWNLDKDATAVASGGLSQWRLGHRAHRPPRCTRLASVGSSPPIAVGRHAAIGLWAYFVRRSNGRTTRTVLVDGRAVVRQVAELQVLVQNLHPLLQLRLTDALGIAVHGGPGSRGFGLVATESHLAPHVVVVNDELVSTHGGGAESAAAVVLGHGDWCVLSLYVDCEGLDLEQDFLERIQGVSMALEIATPGRNRRGGATKQTITVDARRVESVAPLDTQEETRPHAHEDGNVVVYKL